MSAWQALFVVRVRPWFEGFECSDSVAYLLGNEHTCEPPQTTNEGGTSDRRELVGFSAWQWTVTFIWTFLVLIGGPLPGESTAGLVGGIFGAFLGSMVIVWAVSAVYAKLKSAVGGGRSAEETPSES